MSTQGRIMYVCTGCADGAPEQCGRYDRTELRVMPDGRWLCDECYDSDYDTPGDQRIPWSSLPPPPAYAALAGPPA